MADMAPPALRCALILLLLLALAPAPQASAQGEPGAPTRVMEDLAGDLQTTAGTPGPVPRGSMDLRFLDVTEAMDNLTFTVGVSPDSGTSDQGVVEVHFAHGDAEFRLHLEQRNLVGGWWWMFNLYRVEADGESFVAIKENLPRDRVAGTVTAVLEKKDLADRDGVIPFVGRRLTGFWAETLSFATTPLPLTDRMPDAGTGQDFTFAIGEVQQGDVELWSSSPTRASNGEATTVVFTVTARHTGAAEGRFVFDAEGVPDAWEVVFPQQAPLLGPGETADFPVLVGLPFRHQHGKVEDVRVTLTNVDDEADRGSVRLSVNYHSVPQPAGHHDTLYLHSTTLGDGLTLPMQTAGVVYDRVSMNTLDEFPADRELSVPPGYVDPNTWAWQCPLDPVLQMGLDFDLGRTGALSIPFTSQLGITGAVVGGTLDLDWQDAANGEPQSMVLVDLVSDDPQDLAPGAQTRLTATMVPRAEADLVPYREGANLVLRLQVQGTPAGSGFPGPEKPWLDPGGSFSLPLFEYSDPVDGLFSSLQGVQVLVEGPAQRQGNPGEVVRFPLSLRYTGSADFLVTFAGQGAAQAQVVGGPRVKADADGTTFEVAVLLPAEAQDGDLLDILVVAQKVDDAGVQGIVRVVPEADTQQDHPDMPLAGADAADAPAAPLWMALAALAALAGARRRRSD